MRRIALPIPMCTHQHHREKREYPYPLFIQDSEAHHHKNQPLLPQERQAKGGDIQTKETCHKDGKGLLPSKTKPLFFQKVKQKEEETASPKKHFLFIQGSPITQVALNRWYKNERSPRNTHLDITTPKRNISLETS